MIPRLAVLVVIVAAGYHGFLRRTRLPVHIVAVVGLLAAAGLLIACPALASPVAGALGIERGADLAIYLVVAGLWFTSLRYYTKFVELHGQTAALARELALLRAELGPDDPRPLARPRAPVSLDGGRRTAWRARGAPEL